VTDTDTDDWRLEATVDHPAHGDQLDHVIDDSRTAAEGATVGEDVVVTHDDNKLFAYASGRAALDGARAALEAALDREHLAAEVVISRWEEKLELWRQVEPPLDSDTQGAMQAAEQEADTQVTRTLVASAGRFVQTEFEQTMVAAATRLELEYKLVEHRHLLTTQVAFTVTGPRHAVAEFERELRATARTTVRTQEEIGFSL